ncbi:MAG: hypothetical protein J5496_06800 [Lachnospiraceae bacterium]|nr:hypothetical protein [Lachnospiraceae bacterium]
MSKRNYDEFVSESNTPHLKEKTFIIGASYFFLGVHFVIEWRWCVMNSVSGQSKNYYYLLELGIVFLLLVPIVIRDNRKVHRGTLYAFISASLYIFQGVILGLATGFWWGIIYLSELIVCIVFVFLTGSKKKNR